MISVIPQGLPFPGPESSSAPQNLCLTACLLGCCWHPHSGGFIREQKCIPLNSSYPNSVSWVRSLLVWIPVVANGSQKYLTNSSRTSQLQLRLNDLI